MTTTYGVLSESLQKRYGDVPALRGLDPAAPQGAGTADSDGVHVADRDTARDPAGVAIGWPWVGRWLAHSFA
jgi:hypothetical protein